MCPRTFAAWYRALAATLSLALGAPAALAAQSWRDHIPHLASTARVLIVGTRPEDEDNALLAWLGLGRHLETAYLSLTRGESGVNILGSERQSSLAVVRTAELLAERQRDHAHQYFTRAYDFGATPLDSIVDAAWPRAVLLRDLTSIVRAFRPHIVIALVSATDRDATRRRTAELVAETFSIAADSVRMPARETGGLPAWSVARLLTIANDSAGAARAVRIDVGEFDRSSGRSFAEIGAEIRALQRTQPSRRAPSLGPLVRILRIDSTRVGEDASLFGALDTTLARFRGIPAEAAAQLDTLRAMLDSASARANADPPDGTAGRLARIAARTSDVRLALPCSDIAGVSGCAGALGDLAIAVTTIRERATHLMMDAAGIVVDGVADRALVAAGDSVSVTAMIYNGGIAPVTIRRVATSAGNATTIMLRDSSVVLPPDSSARWSTSVRVLSPTYHWWQINGLQSGTYLHLLLTNGRMAYVPQLIEGEDRIITSRIETTIALGGVEVPIIERPLVARSPSTLRGDDRHPLEGVPATSVLLERTEEYERAGILIDRLFRAYVWSARSTPDTIDVTIALPAGLKADSATRRITLAPFGARSVFFRLRGTLRAGADTINVTARSLVAPLGATNVVRVNPVPDARLGVVTHEYPHIPAQQFVRFSSDRLEAVDLRIPPRLTVAYVKGADDLQRPLGQLQVKVQTLDASLLPVVDLSAYTAILVGQGALSGDEIVPAVPALRQFIERGGTVVVLSGSAEIARSGLLPFPIAFDSIPLRVSDPAAPVQVIDTKASVFTWPNHVTKTDFEGWVSERAAAVPSTIDPRYHTLLATGDAGTPPTNATLLTARVGKGILVYSALSLDEQLAAAQPGAARLMINLLSANLAPEGRR